MGKKQLSYKKEIIKQLYFRKALSCTDISYKIKKSLPLTTRTLVELIDDEYVVETGYAASTGGRRPQMYALKDDIMYIVSVAMDQFVTRIALLDMQNRYTVPVKKLELALTANPSSLSVLATKIKDFINGSGIDKSKIVGIGIGMPGFIDVRKGINYTFLDAGQQSVHDYIASKTGLPVFIDNDSRLVALAELSFGNLSDTKNAMVDTFFKGNMTKWQKFANSLRLRYAMQMVEKDPATATPIIQDVLSGSKPLIEDGEDVGMWPGEQAGYDLSARWWSVSSGGTGFLRMSSTMWNLVSDDNTDGGIFDPRAKLFVEPNQAGAWAPYTIGTSTGDNVNAYISGTDQADKNGALYSPLNWYLVRDEWYIPEVIFSAAEVHFLKAEASARGLGVAQNTGTAETEYKAGITSSVKFWYFIASNTDNISDGWKAVAPAPPTSGKMDTLFANPKVAFTGTSEDAVKKIYAQEWLSFFRQPWLAYNLWRRTTATPVDPASNPSATFATFYRLPYAQDEAVNNTDNFNAQVAKIGGNTSDIKVWWMK